MRRPRMSRPLVCHCVMCHDGSMEELTASEHGALIVELIEDLRLVSRMEPVAAMVAMARLLDTRSVSSASSRLRRARGVAAAAAVEAAGGSRSVVLAASGMGAAELSRLVRLDSSRH